MYFALVLLSGERTVAMRGCTREELIGRNVRECRPREDPAALPALLAAVWPDEGTVFETLHRRRDGSVVPIEMPSRTMRLDGDEVLLSAFRGIMERKRAEEALQQRTAELAARNEELMRFDRAAACRETRMVELRQVVKEAIR